MAMRLLLSRAVKPNTKVGGAADRFASPAGAGNLSFPIRPLFVKSTLHPPSFGDCAPGVCGAWDRGDHASLREGDSAGISSLPLFHGKAA